MVPRMFGKAHHLVLERRAIARAHALDHARIHRRALQVRADDLRSVLRGVREVAGTLLQMQLSEERRRGVPFAEGELATGAVGRLHRHGGEVNRLSQHAHGRAGLEATQLQAEFVAQARRQPRGGRVTRTPARDLLEPEMQRRRQEGTGCQHHRLRAPFLAEGRAHAADLPMLVQQQRNYLALKNIEIWCPLQHELHPTLVHRLVALRARREGRRAHRLVEHPELDGRGVRVAAHLAAQRVDFAHQLTFRHPADAGIAGHLGDVVVVQRQQ